MTPNASLRAARRAAALIVALTAVAAPSAALADGSSGGAGLSGSSSTPSGATSGPYSSATAPIAAAPADNPVSAAADGLSISTHSASTLKKTITFSGSAPTNAAGMTVQIQRSSGATTWVNIAQATVTSSGSYTVHWVANHAGQMNFRALLTSAGSAGGQPTAGAASASAASPAVTVNVFTDAIATIYGPGFYGHKTACGQKLTKTTLGVASRTLPCGDQVQVYWHGNSITVPVIDRGPYSNHASWDLTMATAQALGISETETVGTIHG